MKNDFILDECELSIAANKLSNLSLSLSESIDDYVEIMSNVQSEGIKDQLICAEIESIKYLAKIYQKDILTISEQLSREIISSEISDAESNDNFKFPSDAVTEVTYILSQFI